MQLEGQIISSFANRDRKLNLWGDCAAFTAIKYYIIVQHVFLCEDFFLFLNTV